MLEGLLAGPGYWGRWLDRVGLGLLPEPFGHCLVVVLTTFADQHLCALDHEQTGTAMASQE